MLGNISFFKDLLRKSNMTHKYRISNKYIDNQFILLLKKTHSNTLNRRISVSTRKSWLNESVFFSFVRLNFKSDGMLFVTERHLIQYLTCCFSQRSFASINIYRLIDRKIKRMKNRIKRSHIHCD